MNNLINKYKNLNLNNINIQTNKDEFNQKIKEGFNYPCYPNHKYGKNLLLNIREYLIKRKNKIH